MYYTAEKFIKYSHFKLQNPSKSMLLQTDIHIVFLLLKKRKKKKAECALFRYRTTKCEETRRNMSGGSSFMCPTSLLFQAWFSIILSLQTKY